MTRRIAIAILVSACAMLVIGGAAAYVAVRQTLLTELDETLIERATSVLTAAGVTASDEPAVPPGDRYMIREGGRTLARPDPQREAPLRPQVLSRTFAGAGDGLRVRSMTLRWIAPDGDPVIVVYSTPAERFDRTMRRLAGTLVAVMLVGIAVTAAVAVRVSRAATRPLLATSETIGAIDEQHLDRRIDVTALPTELAPVAQRLNEMLERLQGAFAQRRQFISDAAHELRTPVAALRTTLEVALAHPRDPAALRRTLERCLSSTHMLSRLAHALTEQVRGDRRGGYDRRQPIDATALLSECADVCEPLAAEKQIALSRHIADAISMCTDSDRLRSVAMNLLSNAVEYTQSGGAVRMDVSADEQALTLRISDSGPGIAPDVLPHVFEPFYRGDGSHGSNGEHLGLGLYLVRSHVIALGGTVNVESRLGEGTEFLVTIPRVTSPDQPDSPASSASARDWSHRQTVGHDSAQ